MPGLLLRAGLTSSVICTIGDVVAQHVESQVRSRPEPYDPYRTLRFGIVGLTLHGPYFQRGFAYVDKAFGATLVNGKVIWPILGKKVVFTQFALNAPFMVLLFGWIGALEGRHTVHELQDNIVAKWPAAFWAGNCFWPVANFLNFRYLGPQHRVAYVASCGVMWNTFISLLNKFKDDEAAAAKEATEDAPKGLRELENSCTHTRSFPRNRSCPSCEFSNTGSDWQVLDTEWTGAQIVSLLCGHCTGYVRNLGDDFVEAFLEIFSPIAAKIGAQFRVKRALYRRKHGPFFLVGEDANAIYDYMAIVPALEGM